MQNRTDELKAALRRWMRDNIRRGLPTPGFFTTLYDIACETGQKRLLYVVCPEFVQVLPEDRNIVFAAKNDDHYTMEYLLNAGSKSHVSMHARMRLIDHTVDKIIKYKAVNCVVMIMHRCTLLRCVLHDLSDGPYAECLRLRLRDRVLMAKISSLIEALEL